MDLWYSRPECEGADYRIKVCRPLFSAESREKRIDVFETEEFGKLLVIDGQIAASEAEGESYMEMAVHVPLNVHPEAAAVLVVGGGDGGILSRLVLHSGIERITLVEPDEGVIDAAKRWFPSRASAFSDPRLKVINVDPSSFVRDTKERFDLVIVDAPENAASSEKHLLPGLLLRLLQDTIRRRHPRGSSGFGSPSEE